MDYFGQATATGRFGQIPDAFPAEPRPNASIRKINDGLITLLRKNNDQAIRAAPVGGRAGIYRFFPEWP
jgi:hypothetical protein